MECNFSITFSQTKKCKRKRQLHKKSLLALTVACAEMKESFHFSFPTTFSHVKYSFLS